MKKLAVFLSTLAVIGTAGAANLQDCISVLEKDLTATLKSARLNLSSSTLANDVTNLLQPVFDKTRTTDNTCVAATSELTKYASATISVDIPPAYIFDIEMQFGNKPYATTNDVPEELETLFPWYGILVVKKGSLDSYADSETPIISSVYMKNNKNTFFPANSDKALGLVRGCTHGNHTAHDKDVVNRAAHITMNEKDSFWTGNDYYVYDGEDVYWGTAQLVGEIALALITWGASAAVEAGATSATAAASTASGVMATTSMVKAASLTTNTTKIQKAIRVAKAARDGRDAAAVASRAEAVTAMAEAGITVKKGATAAQLANIAATLEGAASGIRTVTWASALAQPWKMVALGMKQIKPTTAKLFGPGVTWGKRLKNGAIAAAGVGAGYALSQKEEGLWKTFLKAFGYSTASVQDYADGVPFNSFGLLSADDLPGRENEVSHGAWLMFEEAGTVNEDDALNEALAFAEEFQKDMQKINDEDPMCDVDIYVVQPGISNKAKLKTREIYYVIQNPGGSLRVSPKK